MVKELLTKEHKALTPVGRPPKYRREFCKDMLDVLMSGKSINCFCVLYGVTPSTVHTWRKKYPEFDYAFELAECARKEYIECKVLSAALGEYKGYDHKLLNTLYNHIVVGPQAKQNGTNIQVNIDNTTRSLTEIANLSPEDRQHRIEILKHKLIEQGTYATDTQRIADTNS